MAQANNKTQPTEVDVWEFIASIENAGRRDDAGVLVRLMAEATGETPVVWGNIVGFGSYDYKYDSGREGTAMLTGFAPRKANMVVYVMPGFEDYGTQLGKLGKHKLGRSCLYLGRLSNVDLDVLSEIVTDSVAVMRKRYH